MPQDWPLPRQSAAYDPPQPGMGMDKILVIYGDQQMDLIGSGANQQDIPGGEPLPAT
jgi:hypothetical protein